MREKLLYDEYEEPQESSVESREGDERNVIIEQAQQRRGNLLSKIMTSEIVSNGLDLLPFAGGGKMLVESASGKTLSGTELTGRDRAIHAAIGAGSLVLDCVGVGEVNKGRIVAGKSIGWMEKIGTMLSSRGATRGAAIFEKTAEFMASHPEAVRIAEQYTERKLKDFAGDAEKYRASKRKKKSG